jgi:hypothetical protein
MACEAALVKFFVFCAPLLVCADANKLMDQTIIAQIVLLLFKPSIVSPVHIISLKLQTLPDMRVISAPIPLRMPPLTPDLGRSGAVNHRRMSYTSTTCIHSL